MTQLRVAFITTIASEAVPLISAIRSVNEKFGEIVKVKLVAEIPQVSESPMDDFIQSAQQSHITIIYLMGDLPECDRLISSLKGAGVPLFIAASSSEEKKNYPEISTVDPDDYRNILGYIKLGGKKNLENLLLYLANRFLGANYEVGAYEQPSWEGIYHPRWDHTPTIDEYLKNEIAPDRPTVGIWFHQSHWQSGDLHFVDSLIGEIERQGANVLPVFFSGSKDPDLGIKGFQWVIENYFMKEGKPLVDAIISALSFSQTTYSSNSGALSTLKCLDVPIIKAILTLNTFESWHDNIQGLNVVEIPMNVAMPEFDGFLITVPIATMSFSQTDPLTGAKIIQHVPIPERVEKVVRLSVNWAKLHRTRNSEKRVAIIFHNYPPRNDTIGKAFAIDTSVSVLGIMQNMKDVGYRLDRLPEDGQKLMVELLNGLTNDRRWLSASELAEKASAKIPSEQYAAWFNEIPADVRDNLEKHWGKLPGELFNYKGDLLVPGIVNGNVFIGLQPPRGLLEDPASIYHSPDLPPPYHYCAYYRWIRDVFRANVVIHVGTHGTLEWLPGKSVGLSASCFPDIVISDLPNVYAYVITNPGEGAQAKRRSYACIVDYLIPVMHNADLYEETAQLEVQLKEYYDAKGTDAGKLSVLKKLIWEKVVEAKLDNDLKVTQDSVFGDFDGFLETLHDYLHELADTQIRDGLHVLGVPPTGPRLDEFLVTLTRLRNGSVPSLRQSIAELKGYDYEDLLANKGKLRPDGRTNGDVINEINDLALEFMKNFDAADFNERDIDIIATDVLGGISPDVKRCLTYVATFLVPALEKTTDEVTNIMASFEGHYVPPGPAGSVTRGMADILPTGRNFYSLDPRTVPSVAAWRVGTALGDTLLERYLKEEGKYPESVGIILWAIPTMKTKGDDIAEILYLMGVKPVWEESSGRVVGVKEIPLEELKRPRIDVTVRISGLFRDTFPNVVHLIDDAVNLVAGLNESQAENCIVKHVETEVKERVAKGDNAEKAREEACFRVFGDRPGAYGCGISEAIDSKNWKDQKDLANIYVTWGSYAYTRKTYGGSVPEQFKLRLSKINLTVQNEESRELDILDSDDRYDAHGGMIAAVKTFGGKAPKSYCGDSSDPDRVKIRSTAEETCHVFRSRLLNPKYIEGLKRHEYHGAAELSRMLDYVLGWDATVEVVEDWMYEGLAQKYVLDPKMQEWLKEVNPYALQNMVERLLETIERGMWQASEEMKRQLQQLYLEIEGLLEGANEKK